MYGLLNKNDAFLKGEYRMPKIVAPAFLVVLLGLSTLGVAQGPMHSLPAIAAQIQVMQVNDVLRAKVRHEGELQGAGIDGVKAGDEVELEKRPDGAVNVKHLPTGQVGVLPAVR